MYTEKNYQTKKAMMADVTAGVRVPVFQPGPFRDGAPQDGFVCLEGPHYPQPHRWYARVLIADGFIVRAAKKGE
jgi:hypothetical protein